MLAAAYECFIRHGIRRTTMDDIAACAGMSRPAVYQYVRGKDEAFRRLAQRTFDGALERAQAAAAEGGGFQRRLAGVLGAKVNLVLRLWQDSPHHAGELIGASSTVGAAVEQRYEAQMRELVASLVRDAVSAGELPAAADASGFAAVALALTRGLEADPRDPASIRAQLRLAVALLAAGLTAATEVEVSGAVGCEVGGGS